MARTRYEKMVRKGTRDLQRGASLQSMADKLHRDMAAAGVHGKKQSNLPKWLQRLFGKK